MTEYIVDIYPTKAQFIKNENIELVLELYNPTQENKSLTLDIKISKLIDVVETSINCVILTPGESKSITISLEPKAADFEGYGVDTQVFDGEALVQLCSTSFDVVSDWRKAIRYGFLSDFSDRDKSDAEDVKSMCKYHLNLVQFYDWMYRHDDFLPEAPEFVDLMGRNVNMEVVKYKIAYCHEYGMRTMAYGAIYAASKDFYNKHKEWGFYNSSGEVYNFIDIFKIMNIAPDSPWHNHIIGEYKKAVTEMGFDGIHMDTYGFPKVAISRMGDKESIESLDKLFPILINNTRKELEKVNPDACLIFNNVGNWPVDTVGDAEQNAVYVEVWEPYEKYHHIQQIIQWAKYLGKGKPVILAAYLKPFMKDSLYDTKEAQFSALLLTSVIAANGGYHLLLGEKNGILTQGYYVDYSTLDGIFARKLRNYYDFIVRYSKVIFDPETRDVSMTHCFGENQEYIFENADYSPYGEPGKVWVTVREKPELKTISFINMTNNTEDYWNKGKNEPKMQKDLLVKVQIPKLPKSVYIASPDNNQGRPAILDYTIEDSDRGKILTVRIPELNIWNLLVIDF